jgi:hypothetical protein
VNATEAFSTMAMFRGRRQRLAGAETREQLAALAARIEHAGARVEKAAPAIFPRAREVFVHLQGALLGQDCLGWCGRSSR